jgi:hypothetical protein
MSAPTITECGFFGLSTPASEADLREAVRHAATTERDNWFKAGSVVSELEDSQFGHLVRYWLARMADIPAATLTSAQAKAIDGSIDYSKLFKATVSDTDIAAIRGALLAGATVDGSPANLNDLVDVALRWSRLTRLGEAQWSAVFIVSCIRDAAIALGLEGVCSSLHVGRDALLLAFEGHRFYVREAHQRQFGLDPREGTYHAFRPDAHPVQVGDIIVVDTQIPEGGDVAHVVTFDGIPTVLDPAEYKLHGDIVVAVTSSYAETIGGNLCYREPLGGNLCDLDAWEQPCSVRKRRFPVHGDGKLVVDREQMFVQEDNSGGLLEPPVVCSADGLHARSTGRIFTLLSPVEACRILSASA